MNFETRADLAGGPKIHLFSQCCRLRPTQESEGRTVAARGRRRTLPHVALRRANFGTPGTSPYRPTSAWYASGGFVGLKLEVQNNNVRAPDMGARSCSCGQGRAGVWNEEVRVPDSGTQTETAGIRNEQLWVTDAGSQAC